MLTLHGELDISTQQLLASALAGVDENAARIRARPIQDYCAADKSIQ